MPNLAQVDRQEPPEFPYTADWARVAAAVRNEAYPPVARDGLTPAVRQDEPLWTGNRR